MRLSQNINLKQSDLITTVEEIDSEKLKVSSNYLPDMKVLRQCPDFKGQLKFKTSIRGRNYIDEVEGNIFKREFEKIKNKLEMIK